MSLFDAMLGAGASQSILGISLAQQQAYGIANSSAQQAQAQAQYTQAQMNRFNTHKWVFNGKACTLQEFADCIWPEDHEDKMLFLLTHSGPAVAESTP